MNKKQLLVFAILAMGCDEASKEKTSEKINQKIDKEVVSGYTVTSSVIPAYLTDIRENYDRNHFKYTESLDDKGYPVKLMIHNKSEDGKIECKKIEYTYDQDHRLTETTTINVLRPQYKPASSDTMRYTFTYNGHLARDRHSLDIGEYTFLFDNENRLLEFMPDLTSGLQSCMINQYDQFGRLSSSIRLQPQGLFDTDVVFEKYQYRDDNPIWASREVSQMVVKYDNDETFLDEEGIVKVSIDDIRKKILVFPDSFDQNKKTFTDQRKIETLR